MNKVSFTKIATPLICICPVIFLTGMVSIARMPSHSWSAMYLVGEYGYLQKLDRNLRVVATGQAPNLVRRISVRDADISPDGNRLFLAVSSGNNPLVVVRAADLTVDQNVRIPFPSVPKPWETYFPLSIAAASSTYVYMTDECYSSAPRPYGTVLVDLKTATSKPIYDYTFMSRTQIQIPPDSEKMALCSGGKLYFIDISAGEVVDLISGELVSRKLGPWFDINWKENTAELYGIPEPANQELLEKISINIKSREIIHRRGLKGKTIFGLRDEMFGLSSEVRYRRILTASSLKRYIQDGEGNIQIFDRKSGKFLDRLDHTLFEKLPGRPVVSYISPDEKLLFYRKDEVKQIAGGLDSRDISSFCVVDMQASEIIKTLHLPQKIVAVLFSE